MSKAPFSDLARISDEKLIRGLETLLRDERQLEAEILAHVAEVDARRLYLERGFDSMFRYCVEDLRLSEGAAYHRIHVARAARRFPVILQMVAEGQMHLSGLVLLAPHLTDANHARLLEAATSCSKREIEELVATLFPRPLPPAYVARVPEEIALPLDDASATAHPSTRVQRAPASVRAVRAQQYKVQFVANSELRDQLEELQALLRHQIPDGDLGEIFQRAIALLLQETKRRRFAETDKPRRTGAPEKPSRHIPAAIKREVHARDDGRCTYTSASGLRCSSRAFLEYHHASAWAKHGRHRADEITLHCRAHNALAAREEYGAQHMQRFEQSPGTVHIGTEAPPGERGR